MTTIARLVISAEIDASGTATGARNIVLNLNKVEQAAQRAAKSEDLLDRATRRIVATFGLYQVARLAKETFALADSYTELHARLGLVTHDTAELSRVQAQLFRVSQETRTELGGNVAVYASLTRSTKALGLSANTMIGVTGTIAKSFKISGASVSETANATRQLGQALASGTLRGDEFNSIAENAPRLQQAVAESLGVTIGQLRQMASEGKLTGKIITEALINKAGEIDAEFRKMPVTVSGAFTQIKNAVLLAVGDIDAATGASGRLAAALTALANKIPDVIDGVRSFRTEIVSLLEVIGTAGLLGVLYKLGSGTVVGAFFSLASSVRNFSGVAALAAAATVGLGAKITGFITLFGPLALLVAGGTLAVYLLNQAFKDQADAIEEATKKGPAYLAYLKALGVAHSHAPPPPKVAPPPVIPDPHAAEKALKALRDTVNNLTTSYEQLADVGQRNDSVGRRIVSINAEIRRQLAGVKDQAGDTAVELRNMLSEVNKSGAVTRAYSLTGDVVARIQSAGTAIASNVIATQQWVNLLKDAAKQNITPAQLPTRSAPNTIVQAANRVQTQIKLAEVSGDAGAIKAANAARENMVRLIREGVSGQFDLTSMTDDQLSALNAILGAMDSLTTKQSKLKNVGLTIGGVAQSAGSAVVEIGSQALRGIVIALSPITSIMSAIGDAAKPLQPIFDQFASIVRDTLGPVFEAFAPVLQALIPLIRAIFQVLSPILRALAPLFMAFIPILEALFPLFKFVAVVVTYLGQAVALVSQIILNIVGALSVTLGGIIAGLGSFISKIPFLGGVGRDIRDFGNGIKNFGHGAFEAANKMGEAVDALGKARDEINNINIDPTAEAVDHLADAANSATSALLNVPTWYKIALARFAAAAPEMGQRFANGPGAITPPRIPISAGGTSPSTPSGGTGASDGSGAGGSSGGGGQTEITFSGDIIVDARTMSAGQFFDMVLSEGQKRARTQLGDKTKWAEVQY